jgi:hypothetical protein
MAWTALGIWPANGTPNASDFNTYISDNLQWIKDNQFSASDYGVAPVLSRASGNLSCSGSYQDIAGGSITLGGAGKYAVTACARISTLSGGAGVWRTVEVQLLAGGTVQPGTIVAYLPNAQDITMGKSWRVVTGGSAIALKIQAKHSGDTTSIAMTDTFVEAHQIVAP